MSDLHARLIAAVQQRRERSARMQRAAQEYHLTLQEPKLWGKQVPGWGEWPEIEAMMAADVRHCDRDLTELAVHGGPDDDYACHGCNKNETCSFMVHLAEAYDVPADTKQGDSGG